MPRSVAQIYKETIKDGCKAVNGMQKMEEKQQI
jgi:hypothetical protein